MRASFIVAFAALCGCAGGQYQYSWSPDEPACDIAKGLAEDDRAELFQNLRTTGSSTQIGDICVARVDIAKAAHAPDTVAQYTDDELDSAITKTVAAYRTVLMDAVAIERENVADAADSAMCGFASLDDGNARMSTFAVSGSRDLGGPGALKLLFREALKRDDILAVRTLLSFFAEVQAAGGYTRPFVCAQVPVDAFRDRLQTLLREYRASIAAAFVSRYDFLLDPSVANEDTMAIFGNMTVRDIARTVIHEKLAALNFDQAEDVMSAMHLEDDILRDMGEEAMLTVYRNAFLAHNFATPEAAVSILSHFGFDVQTLQWAHTHGYVAAADTMWDRIATVVENLPQEARVALAQKRIRGPGGSSVEALRAVHRFMRLADVASDEVRFDIGRAIGKSTATGVDADLAVAYVEQRMGLTPRDLWNESTCTGQRPTDGLADHAFDLRCGGGMERVHRVAQAHPEKLVPLPL